MLLMDPPVRWVHLASAVLWPASALVGMWKARSLIRRRSRRTTYALVAVACIVGAENLLQAMSTVHPTGLSHLIANVLLTAAGVVAVFAMVAYGTQAFVEERVLYALSRGHLTGLPAHSASPRVLTPRELEVLTCLCLGLRTDGIASRLSISPHTADTHVRNLMKKLGVSSRVDAVGWAIRAGVFDPASGRVTAWGAAGSSEAS